MLGVGLHGWTRVDSKNKVHFVAPEGPMGGVITVRERARPRSLGELLGVPRMGAQEVAFAPEVLVTPEGEQAAVVCVRAAVGGREMQRDAAVIAGDGFCATVEAVTPSPEWFARTTRLVRQLVVRMRMLLGVRRRLVLYPPPPGWHGVARGLDAHWYAPRFPQLPAHILVSPAVPAHETTAGAVLDALLAPAGEWRSETRSTPRGLEFEVRARGDGRIAVSVDGRFAYAVRVSGADDEAIAAFDAVVAGMHPVPHAAADTSAFDHWGE